MLIRTIILGCALTCSAVSQQGPTLVGSSYAGVKWPVIAPGQVVHFQFSGLKTLLPIVDGDRFVKATSVPLPTVLAGISVVVRQEYAASGHDAPTESLRLNAPIFSILQSNICRDGSTEPECLITDIMVQIPYELNIITGHSSQIIVAEHDLPSQMFLVAHAPDQMHVITSEDPSNSLVTVMATHIDGTLVTASSPASPGETVVIYAWGLGLTTPSSTTGAPAPDPGRPISPVPGLPTRFDFVPNAGPIEVYDASAPLSPAYLTPGYVGLYQINVQLPARFPSVSPCGGYVRSNLTITFRTGYSEDGAPICAATAL